MLDFFSKLNNTNCVGVCCWEKGGARKNPMIIGCLALKVNKLVYKQSVWEDRAVEKRNGKKLVVGDLLVSQ